MAENDLLSGWRTFLQQLHARKIEAATARPIDLADVAMIDEVLGSE